MLILFKHAMRVKVLKMCYLFFGYERILQQNSFILQMRILRPRETFRPPHPPLVSEWAALAQITPLTQTHLFGHTVS